MVVRAGQIYFVKNAVLGKATYARPLLVLRVSGNAAHVTPFSTQFELKEPGDVAVYSTDEDFKKTGITMTRI